jgi:hypothetical protein
MQQGEIYQCEGCGMELQVLKECEHAQHSSGECNCHDDGSECAITGCGKELVKKPS